MLTLYAPPLLVVVLGRLPPADTDDSGFLELNEIHAALHCTGKGGTLRTNSQVQSLLTEADTNNDGVVDFDEFVKVMEISKKWQAVRVGYGETAFNVAKEFFAPFHRAVRNHTAVYHHDLAGGRGVMAAPSLPARFVAGAFGLYVFNLMVGTAYRVEQGLRYRMHQGLRLAEDTAMENVVYWSGFLLLTLSYFFFNIFGNLFHSCAHDGHMLFGYTVVDAATGKPAGTNGMIGRFLVERILPFTLSLNIWHTPGGDTIARDADLGIAALLWLDVISLAASGRRVADNLLQQKVVFSDAAARGNKSRASEIATNELPPRRSARAHARTRSAASESDDHAIAKALAM